MQPSKVEVYMFKEVFMDSKSSQEKGCPKSAFLGLCEEGFIKEISKGKYTSSVKN